MIEQAIKALAGWKGYAATGIGCALVAAWISLTAQGWLYDARIAKIERDHAQVLANYSQAAERAQAEARATEQARVAAIEAIRNEADQELAAAIGRERAAADVRVRSAADDYAARYRAAASRASAAAERQAADSAIRMFAELLGQSDDLAAIYAAAVDRARIAGLACERAYDSLMP